MAKESRASAAATQRNKTLPNDSSPLAEAEQDGLLFPIAPDTNKPGKAENEESLAVRKPVPEELLLPSHDETKSLCSLAAQIKELAPWQWMQETDVFGVEDPDTGEIGFVSVMGNVEEYQAVAVYCGAEGIFGLIDFQCDPSASADRLFEIPQVQASFTEPKFLAKRDRDLLKAAGLKFKGTKPLFRSYRPGFLPWFITLKEARLLIQVLSQTLEMAKRFAGQPALFPDEGDGETEPFLVRVSRKENTELIWEDQIKRIPRPKAMPIQFSIDVDLLRDLKRLQRAGVQLEADLFIGPGGIGTSRERPLALYLLMLADGQSGIILGFEGLTAEHSLDTMYASIPETIVRLLWQAKVLPKQINVRSDLLLNLLEFLERELKIQLRHANKLPGIDSAVASMFEFFETGKM
jgi:hypothetical protein